MNTYYNGQEEKNMQINISNNTVLKFRHVENDNKKSFSCCDILCHNIDCDGCIFDNEKIYRIEDLEKEDRIK